MSEQTCMTYDVRMQTSIGIRLGRITIYQMAEKINGYFDILNHSEPFEGIIDRDGNCKVYGKIITLMRTINYVATGQITSDSLKLSIQDDSHTLNITGTPCQS